MHLRQVLLGSVVCVLAPASGAVAQTAPPDQSPKADAQPSSPGDATPVTGGIGDIIVTARKQNERINDVPMSITAATGETLIRQGVTQISDLQKLTPGFAFQPSPYGNPVYNLRGVGNLDDTIAAAPTVSIYIDQAPIPFSVMAQGTTFDVERVEILKGPQGTLFGQNSTGGAINFVANKPTRSFATGFDLTGGNYGTFNARGYASGPVTDTLAARIAVAVDKRGDWQRSVTRPNDTLGQRSFFAGRFLLDWNPTNRARLSLNVNGWLDDSDTQAAQFLFYSPTKPASAGGYTDLAPYLSTFPRAPDNARAADWDANRRLHRHDNYFQTTLRGEFDVTDAMTVTSLTAYSRFNRDFPIDVDGTPATNLLMDIVGHIKSFSQELRVNGKLADDRIKLMVGANYQRDQSSTFSEFLINSSNNGVGPFRFLSATNDYSQNVRTRSAFGSADFVITGKLTAQGSVRYTDSRNGFDGCLRDSGDGTLARAFSVAFRQPIATGQCVTLNVADGRSERIFSALNQTNTAWRAGLDWKPAPGTLLYGNVTRGFKAGSYPVPPAIASTQLTPSTQEQLTAYEVGFKQSLLNKTFQLNGAAYYYNYANKQTSGYVTSAFGNLPGSVSIPKSSVRGAELSVLWQPISSLTLNVSGSYVDSKVDSDFLANDPFGRSVNVKGEPFPTAPKWTVTSDVEYRAPISDRAVAYVGASPRYRSSTVAAFGGDPNFIIHGYLLLDLRAGVELNGGRWRAELFGRNVTDKLYIITVEHVLDTVSRLTGLPATYGATISFRY